MQLYGKNNDIVACNSTVMQHDYVMSHYRDIGNTDTAKYNYYYIKINK